MDVETRENNSHFPVNRLILIGNGFDLAHGMKTEYRDFINYIYKRLSKDLLKNKDIETPFYNTVAGKFIDDYDNEQISKIIDYKSLETLCERDATIKNRIIFKNTLFFYYSTKAELRSWGGFEFSYYENLKFFLSSTFLKFKEIKWFISKSLNIHEFHNQFEIIKLEFGNYLASLNKKNLNKFSKLEQEIFNPKIQINELSGKIRSKIVTTKSEVFAPTLVKNSDFSIDNVTKKIITIDSKLPMIDSLLFLSFNYTQTEDLYKKSKEADKYAINTKTIHIHGDLNNERNPIIFGYGDEIDDDYKQLEKNGNDEFLKNVKSIWYLKTDNYKQLQDWLESNYFQVYIFGHSCANSDRTLLNYIFEHDNCVTIKPYYYEPNLKTLSIGNADYTKITMNITRCFNDKLKMRDRIVDIQHCKPIDSLK